MQAAAARAEEFTCLTARGIESEATLAHAGLLELLTPLRAHLDDVPREQAAALAAALGWGPVVEPGDRFLVGAGTLALLAAAAERAPVLVLLDDLQWIDAESTAALLFAARRMHHDRIAFLLARRAGGPPTLDGVDVVTVGDLSVPEAQELLAPDLPGAVVRNLVGRIGGNPLALLEVASRLEPAERRGTRLSPTSSRSADSSTRSSIRSWPACRPAHAGPCCSLAASHEGRASAVAVALERLGRGRRRRPRRGGAPPRRSSATATTSPSGIR